MIRLLLVLSLLPVSALARSTAPELLCAQYPDSPLCIGGQAACTTCHALSGPPSRNPFGQQIREQLSLGGVFEDEIEDALRAVELLDADGDGADNLAEILGGTQPGFDSAVEPECAEQAVFDNPWYSVGVYDPVFAFKRVTLDFCGRSPRYDEAKEFEALGPQGRTDALHAQLDACLQSPYWRSVLTEMGVGVVRPNGPATDINVLGNWAWDVRLFRYAMSGDRDAADLLRAQYLVVEEPPGTGRLAAIDEPRDVNEAYAQPLAREDRYGLVTTRYSLAMNVMFAPMPRTLVAHVYRELLGLDIAKSQGLFGVDELDGEYPWDSPRDVDSLGVWQEGCAACHATLDPMAYPWARYNGIDLDGDTTGTMIPDRAADILPEVDGTLFGEPIAGPAEWIEAAVASDAFPQRIVTLLWERVMRRAPYSCESDEFEALWRGFADDRNAERTLHRLIDADAYGVP